MFHVSFLFHLWVIGCFWEITDLFYIFKCCADSCSYCAFITFPLLAILTVPLEIHGLGHCIITCEICPPFWSLQGQSSVSLNLLLLSTSLTSFFFLLSLVFALVLWIYTDVLTLGFWCLAWLFYFWWWVIFLSIYNYYFNCVPQILMYRPFVPIWF